ncbi:hypothetical protein GWI33_005966 [Rhynchophorus ferrugineus]|uniref:Uncharacterized protein n=1 Tax=Rhynchophorus ferrugineus TaxID=354439 RepID=A0A834IW76_RHYFE|nr:hypothetical protein GWI33_005966 [Rhynchophorus ferrugineus]
MVVLQDDGGSPLQAPAAAAAALFDSMDYRQTSPCLKMLPKRYINLHNWLSPFGPKDLKLQLNVTNETLLRSHVETNPATAGRNWTFDRLNWQSLSGAIGNRTPILVIKINSARSASDN